MLARPWPRSSRPSTSAGDAVAVVLHHELEVAVGDLAVTVQCVAPLCLMMLLVASRRMRVVCT
jgi:hypothetical protein